MTFRRAALVVALLLAALAVFLALSPHAVDGPPRRSGRAASSTPAVELESQAEEADPPRRRRRHVRPQRADTEYRPGAGDGDTPDPERRTLRIELPDDLSLEGHAVWFSNDEIEIETHTDARGEVSLPAQLDSSAAVYVAPISLDLRRFRDVTEDALATTPQPVRPFEIDAVLVAGIVVDEDGAAVPGAVVEERSEGRAVGVTLSGTDGRFTLRVWPDWVATLRITTPRGDGGQRFLPAVVRVQRESDATPRVILERGAELRGLVRGPDGTPQGGLRLVVTPNWERLGRGRPDDEPPLRATTDTAGRFVVRGLRPGFHRVRLDNDEPAGAHWLADTDVNTRAAEVTIDLAPGVSLSGVALTADGSPFASQRLFLRVKLGGEYPWTDTDEVGRFRFVRVPEGEHEVLALVEVGRMRRFVSCGRARSGQTRVVLRLSEKLR